MLHFNPLIEQRISSGELPIVFKEFIVHILLLELESLSEGTRYRHTKEFDALIVEYARKYIRDTKDEI
jgi:hypothetical protein